MPPEHALYTLCFSVASLLAFGQTQTPAFSDPTAPPFQMRVQHTIAHNDVCALFRADGLFHLERQNGDRFEALEGVLDKAELADVDRMLNEKELVVLAQKNIAVPMKITKRDEVYISILRSPFIQNLTFPDRESRRPFDNLVTPLLHWMDALQKHSHTTLDEYSGRNSCMPPRKIGFSPRPVEKQNAESPKPSSQTGSKNPVSQAEAATPKHPSFLMRWESNHLTKGLVEETCVVVYPSGRYRMEKSLRGYSSKHKVRAFEDSLGETDLEQLLALLDLPELKASTHQNLPEGKVFSEGELTTLAIGREGYIQRLNFASYFEQPGVFSSNVSVSTDPEERVVAPLRKWLKTRIETRKVGALQDATATRCVPQPQELNH